MQAIRIRRRKRFGRATLNAFRLNEFSDDHSRLRKGPWTQKGNLCDAICTCLCSSLSSNTGKANHAAVSRPAVCVFIDLPVCVCLKQGIATKSLIWNISPQGGTFNSSIRRELHVSSFPSVGQGKERVGRRENERDGAVGERERERGGGGGRKRGIG